MDIQVDVTNRVKIWRALDKDSHKKVESVGSNIDTTTKALEMLSI